MQKRTGTKQQRSDDRTTNLSRLIMVIDNLRANRFLFGGGGGGRAAAVRGKNVWWENQ